MKNAKTNRTDKLELRYIPLAQAKLWDENPKLHDIEALMRSIEQHGFGDPPKYDAQLDGLVYGNGRTEALERLRSKGGDPPRGIVQLEDGEWALPVIFGVDADSRAAAVAFAVDHNNLTLLGGANVDLSDLLSMWDEDGLKNLLDGIPDLDEILVSLNVDELTVSVSEEIEAPEEFPSVDEDLSTDHQCPKCGYQWSGPPK